MPATATKANICPFVNAPDYLKKNIVFAPSNVYHLLVAFIIGFHGTF